MRKIARRQKQDPVKALGSAMQALERLQGVPELVAAVKSVGEDLSEIQKVLAMAIQDLGDLDHRFNRFRYAVTEILAIGGTDTDIAYFEAKYDKETKHDDPAQGPADGKDPA